MDHSQIMRLLHGKTVNGYILFLYLNIVPTLLATEDTFRTGFGCIINDTNKPIIVTFKSNSQPIEKEKKFLPGENLIFDDNSYYELNFCKHCFHAVNPGVLRISSA